MMALSRLFYLIGSFCFVIGTMLSMKNEGDLS